MTTLVGVEQQVLVDAATLATAAFTAVVAYATPKLKAWIASHTSAQVSGTANNIINGLASIANATVQQLNQTVVNEAKANGAWNAQTMQSVKQAAVNAVMSQGQALITLGGTTLGDVQQLVSILIEQAVANHKPFTSVLAPATQVSTPAADAAPASSTSAAIA